MAILTTIFFVLFPVVSTAFVIIGFIIDKKNRFTYSLFISFILAIIAYYWIPTENYDLYRHFQILNSSRYENWDVFFNYMIKNKEPLAELISYGVATLNNNSLLTFFTTFVGYSILFYMLVDYAKIKKIRTSNFLLVTCFVLASFTYLNYISGIWNNFAIIIFALGLYLEYKKNTSKKIAYIIYFSTILIHSGLILVVLLKILYDVFKEKISPKIVIIIVSILVFPEIILNILIKVSKIQIFSGLLKMYNAYFLDNSKYEYLHGGKVLIMSLMQLVTYIYIYIISRKKIKNDTNNNTKLEDYLMLLSISILTLMINSGIFIRFIKLVIFSGSFIIMDYLNEKMEKKDNENRKIITMYIIVCVVVFVVYQARIMRDLNFGELFESKLTNNLVTIFNKE